MKRLSTVILLLVMAQVSATLAAENPMILDVWPGNAPGEKGDIGPEKLQPPQKEAKPIKRLTNVSHPTIAVYRPKEAQDTHAAVVICPGGGYNILAIDLEGEEVADWLKTIGVTGIVLKYRVPARKDQPKYLAPLQDAQRALSLVRSHAAEWHIAADRIGILGFSAGGHLAAATATNGDKRQYEPLDTVDKLSCRPDFAVLLYPAYLVQKDGSLSPEIRVTPQSPPCFFAHAGDDRVNPENSLGMYLALKRAGVAAELHIYASGGHGFGLRPTGKPVTTWPRRCEQWLRAMDILKVGAAAATSAAPASSATSAK
jgi:acetyl esterase/lipase